MANNVFAEIFSRSAATSNAVPADVDGLANSGIGTRTAISCDTNLKVAQRVSVRGVQQPVVTASSPSQDGSRCWETSAALSEALVAASCTMLNIEDCRKGNNTLDQSFCRAFIP